MTVIDFFRAREARWETEPAKSPKTAGKKVADICMVPTISPSIHAERVTERDIDALEFFDTLAKEGIVTLITTSTHISYDSIMRVGDPYIGGSYDLSVKDFVRITEPKIGRTKPHEYDDYVMKILAIICIKTKMVIEPHSTHGERDFSSEDLEIFLPELIEIAWMNGDKEIDSYDCMLETDDGMGVVVLPKAFIDVLNTPLLFMLIHMRAEYISYGYGMDEEKNIELCLREGEYTDTTNIPLSLLDTIIVNAIKRSNPLYNLRNISEEELIHIYYQKQVIPTLQPVQESYDE